MCKLLLVLVMVDFELLLDHTGFDDGCPPMEYYYDYDNADIQSMVNSLWDHPFNSEIWTKLSDSNMCFDDSVNDVWLKFLSPINEAIDEFVPMKIRQKRNAKSRVTIWYPRHIRRALSRKHKYWKAYKTRIITGCHQADLCKKTSL